MKDLGKFLSVLIVFMLAYSVSVHSLKFPNVAPTASVILDIIYEPYWNIFGEMFENDGESNICLVIVVIKVPLLIMVIICSIM